MTNEMIELVLDETLRKCLTFIEFAGFESFDPFDALASPLLYRITRKGSMVQRLAIQVNRRSPFNFRPILGITQRRHPMALSHMVRAYVLLSQFARTAIYNKYINDLLDCLQTMAIGEGNQLGWGLNFPYATRFTRVDANTPNLFTTVNVASSFLEAGELLGKQEWINTARNAVAFVIEQLGFVEEGDSIWFRYYPGQEIPVFNVTAMMAAFLTRLSGLTHQTHYDSIISRACLFLAKGQNADGSWFYARSCKGKWIDGFHTAYIIQALDIVNSRYPGIQMQNVLFQGKEFYRTNLFTSSGMPKQYSDKAFPIDGQNCAQAIETLAAISRHYPDCLPLAYKAFAGSYAALFRDLGDKGYFILERRRFIRNRLYSLRWVQAPMIVAMARLLLAGRLSP
jgi:hypothetical protein